MKQGSSPLSNQRSIIRSGKRKGVRTKNNGSMDHVYKIFSPTIKDNIEKVTSTLNNKI